ncbi:adenosylcobinamide amidohydrolase [Streptacidiphilus anmyonensis]|uniref:adenosylcobinamide amidohydrolase n=1 Tax=Streptacidiphilus anmyonensis TaxID=405782 RepID=UPI0009FEFF0F
MARPPARDAPRQGASRAAQVDDLTWAEDQGVTAVVTTGIGVPTWAAAPDPVTADAGYRPGTINILVAVSAPVCDSGLVNLLATATEAKVQALLDADCSCSGTPTDAICVAVREPVPGEQPELFGGPRSRWSSRLARAVHRAVLQGAEGDRTRGDRAGAASGHGEVTTRPPCGSCRPGWKDGS